MIILSSTRRSSNEKYREPFVPKELQTVLWLSCSLVSHSSCVLFICIWHPCPITFVQFFSWSINTSLRVLVSKTFFYVLSNSASSCDRKVIFAVFLGVSVFILNLIKSDTVTSDEITTRSPIYFFFQVSFSFVTTSIFLTYSYSSSTSVCTPNIWSSFSRLNTIFLFWFLILFHFMIIDW